MSRLKKLPVPPRAVHKTPSELLERSIGPITVALVGCGGNGAQMLTKLARLDHALRECGHPAGLSVAVYDPDIVSRANVGRQMFSPSDVGQAKCVVLVNRLNAFYGLSWKAYPECYPGHVERFLGAHSYTQPDLLVTCVDTAKTRREIHEKMTPEGGWGTAPRYWLDLGNKKHEGQVILGEPKNGLNATNRGRAGSVPSSTLEGGVEAMRERLREQAEAVRLRVVTEIFPELLDPELKEDNAPSCSLADALDKQGLFVNDVVTSHAAHLLDALLRKGEIEHSAVFVNLETGRVNSLPVPALNNRSNQGALAA